MFKKTLSLPQEKVWTAPGIENYPANLSFMIADLKLTADNQVKILEFGNGMRALLNGYTYSHNGEWLINRFWAHIFDKLLPNIDTPIFYGLQSKLKNDKIIYETFKNEYQLPTLYNRGIIDTLEYLPRYIERNILGKPSSTFQLNNIFSYSGLLILDHYLGLQKENRQQIQQAYPNFLQLNGSEDFDDIIMNKILSNCLFSDELQNYKPAWTILEKQYSLALTATLRQKIDSNYYVIKPIDACRGNGVTIVPRNKLDQPIAKIQQLYGACAYAQPLSTEERCGYQTFARYWSNDRHPYYLIEEHIQSKPLFIDNQPYDGTMRVVFSLEHSHDYMKINFYDAYWKLPQNPLRNHYIDNTNSISYVSGTQGQQLYLLKTKK